MKRTLVLLLSLIALMGFFIAPVQAGPPCDKRPNHPKCVTPSPTPTPSATPAPTPAPTGITFFDDFTTLGSHWLNDPCGPFGAETVEFRNDLATVANGVLSVDAVRIGPNQWRAGHLSTWGDFEQEFGIWEARIKVPVGRGLWPAFWVLKSGTEPCRGGVEELDVMEILANPEGSNGAEDISLLFQTLHYPTDQQMRTPFTLISAWR